MRYINERADEYFWSVMDMEEFPEYGSMILQSYRKGANEQHKVDTDAALRWLEDNITKYIDGTADRERLFKDFQSAMKL